MLVQLPAGIPDTCSRGSMQTEKSIWLDLHIVVWLDTETVKARRHLVPCSAVTRAQMSSDTMAHNKTSHPRNAKNECPMSMQQICKEQKPQQTWRTKRLPA